MDPNYIVIPLAVLQTGYAAVGFHLDRRAAMRSDQQNVQRSYARPLVMIGFTFLTWSAVFLDYLDRNYLEPQLPDATFISYGVQAPNVLAASLNFRDWSLFKKEKAILITRVPYIDKDRMTDDWITKSTLYTINQPNLVLSVIIGNGKMRFAANMPNTIEYDFAVVPANIDAEQIKTLSDVDRLGGKILISAAQGGIMGGPPSQTTAPPKI